MTWAGFWTAFLAVSLAIYAVMALYVSVRGAAELVTLVRRARSDEPDAKATSDQDGAGPAGRHGTQDRP